MKIPSWIPLYALLLGNFDIAFLLSLLSTISWHVGSLLQFALTFDPLNIVQRLYLWKTLLQHQTQTSAGLLTVQHTLEGGTGLCVAEGAGLYLPSLPRASLQPWVYPTTCGVLRLVLELFHMQKSYSIDLQPFIYKLPMKCDIDDKACFKAVLSACVMCPFPDEEMCMRSHPTISSLWGQNQWLMCLAGS